MENCDLQIVLDEEQDIRYLLKYASNPEQSSHHMNNIMQSLLRNQTGIMENILLNKNPNMNNLNQLMIQRGKL